MPLAPITHASGRAVVIPGNDIDTDRIIPARFLKCVTFDDLAAGLFHDERVNEDGSSKNHPLDAPQHQGASVIITGENFGCGSSREHAPQALKRSGFNAVIAGSFAEIFFGNSTTLGIVCATVSESDREQLAKLVTAQPELEVSLDVDKLTITAGEHTFGFELRSSAREALLTGYWDPIGELMEGLEEIKATAATELAYCQQCGSIVVVS